MSNVNLPSPILIERAIKDEGAVLANNGSINVLTGKRTGRSAKDKFIVHNSATADKVEWGAVNQPISQDAFDALYEQVSSYLDERDAFIFEGFAGTQPGHSMDFRIACELPSQAFFISQLLHVSSSIEEEPFQILVAPGFHVDPALHQTASDAAIMIDYKAKRALICGTRYSGEIKKSVFSIMNFALPDEGILPMHCSANMAHDGRTAIFFGLSGTGKTTLSADPSRLLIGDDEHGWADDGVFNFEAGCYAKCIGLDPEHEPDIYKAIRYGAMTENVVLSEDRQPMYADARYTENTRAAYPLYHIANIEPSGRGNVPSTVIFLTADAFGVLPPISKLTLDQAMYYFLSGYTSKVAGTEVGITEPTPTFSTCFGEPFLPLDPLVYARMLKEKVKGADAQVFLVNTGWNGHGKRMALAQTRAMVNAALSGELDDAAFMPDEIFGVLIPKSCPGCPDEILDPKSSWDDEDAYRAQALKLARMLDDNFKEKYPKASQDVRSAGPRI
ncbi:MAG: phosphoenolpyruvate carboxykinase (ATP) [Eggerthellaceae bacterium]|nr:phosphoenolpyruvate carboxykinase (ATP) [Eggerthellaceae bacterium]